MSPFGQETLLDDITEKKLPALFEIIKLEISVDDDAINDLATLFHQMQGLAFFRCHKLNKPTHLKRIKSKCSL